MYTGICLSHLLQRATWSSTSHIRIRSISESLFSPTYGLQNPSRLCALSANSNQNQVILLFLISSCGCRYALFWLLPFAFEDVIWLSFLEPLRRNWLLGCWSPSFLTWNLPRIRFPKVGIPLSFSHRPLMHPGSLKLHLRGKFRNFFSFLKFWHNPSELFLKYSHFYLLLFFVQQQYPDLVFLNCFENYVK